MRVRFAPSPTGELHVGGARTALYNWLWARKQGGIFILRLEDTDLARSEWGFAHGIVEALAWLGLNWDELYRQSERLPLYQKHVEELAAEGLAYACFCTPEELAHRRRERLGKGEIPEYDGHCRDLTEGERARLLGEGRKPAIRFRVPEETKATAFTDFLRGEIRFRRLTTGDFVIQKSDGTPTYNLACVVDDHLMGITHVLRAEDHLSNTPKQLWLYRALGWEPPEFGHLSLILGPDRHKLSKRHGATTIEELRAEGFLPEAIANGLALLGWSPGTGQEVFTLGELVDAFSLDRVVVAPQVFDLAKLRWLNRQHLARLSPEELLARARPYLPARGGLRPERRWALALEAVRPSISTLKELAKHPDLQVLLGPPAMSPEAREELGTDEVQELLESFLHHVPPELGAEDLRPLVQTVAGEVGVPRARAFQALRLALTGRKEGLELAAVVEVLGWEEVRRRLMAALEREEVQG